MNEKYTNSLGEPTELPYDARCFMCGRVGNREDLAIRKEGWGSHGWNLCWDCYMGKNPDNKKGSWMCCIGLHRWHPILTNPKVCYRCGYRWNNMILPREGTSRIPFIPSWLKFLVEDKQ